jgi:hypothetical protein
MAMEDWEWYGTARSHWYLMDNGRMGMDYKDHIDNWNGEVWHNEMSLVLNGKYGRMGMVKYCSTQ